MLPLSTASMIEKNQISATGVWLMLLDITYNKETVRLVNNTENIQFKGNTYTAFPFHLAGGVRDAIRAAAT